MSLPVREGSSAYAAIQRIGFPIGVNAHVDKANAEGTFHGRAGPYFERRAATPRGLDLGSNLSIQRSPRGSCRAFGLRHDRQVSERMRGSGGRSRLAARLLATRGVATGSGGRVFIRRLSIGGDLCRRRLRIVDRTHAFRRDESASQVPVVHRGQPSSFCSPTYDRLGSSVSALPRHVPLAT